MLYRFRDIDKLIDEKYSELRDQYFFFASPDTLNDPLEGYVDFYWKADKIAWLGLFKNYVWQVFLTLFGFPLCSNFDDINKICFTRSETHLKRTELSKIRIEVEKEFSDEPIIKELADMLGDLDIEITQTSLQFILFHIHNLALFHANKLIEKNGFESFFAPEWSTKVSDLISAGHYANKIKNIKSVLNSQEVAKQIMVVLRSTQLDLALMTNDKTTERIEMIEYVAMGFSENYAKQVVNLAYANWHVVCFNHSYKDPKMWSHYAYNHKGVCLMFEFNSGEEVELEALDATATEKNIKLIMKPIDYKTEPLRVNFFLTLGSLWGDEREHWLIHNQEESSVLSLICKDVEKWRTEYWSNFEKRFLRKGSTWATEKEERLVLDDYFYNHSMKDRRKYKYDFNKLHGVIFGIDTKYSDKKKLIEITKEKCVEHNRKELYIYQARYDDTKETIEKELLMIVK